MTAAQLHKALKSKTPPLVIDVRSGMEYRAGHIPGALNLPLHSIPFRRSKLPEDKTQKLILTCEHGPRAVLAQSLLALGGYKNTELLEGHMLGYKKQKLPLEK